MSQPRPTLVLARSRVSGALTAPDFWIEKKPPGSMTPLMVIDAPVWLVWYGSGGSGRQAWLTPTR